MRAGDLRQRVTIQRRVETPNSFGALERSWEDVATVWAAVEPLQGREFFASKEMYSEVQYRVRMRYREGVEPTMRVLWNGLALDIKAVIDVEARHRELQLMCGVVQ